MSLKNPEKWSNMRSNGPENPENGVKKWLDTLLKDANFNRNKVVVS